MLQQAQATMDDYLTRGVSGVLPPFPVSLALSPVLVLVTWVLD